LTDGAQDRPDLFYARMAGFDASLFSEGVEGSQFSQIAAMAMLFSFTKVHVAACSSV
jgi:hypothetical protein